MKSNGTLVQKNSEKVYKPYTLDETEKWKNLAIPLSSCNASNIIAEGILSPKNSVSYFKASYRGKKEKQYEPLSFSKPSSDNMENGISLNEKQNQAGMQKSEKEESPSILSSTDKKEEKPLFNMVIEGKDGRKDVIEIFKDDSPLLLAYKFCFKNGIDPQLAEPLSEKIKQAFEAWNMQRIPAKHVCREAADEEASNLKKFDSQDFSMLTMKLLNKINIETDSKASKENIEKISPKSFQNIEPRQNNIFDFKSDKENLYERGKNFLVKKNTSLEKKRKRLEEEKEKQLTFHPKINLNPNTNIIIDKRKKLPVNEFLYQSSKFREKKRVISMKRQEDALMSNYPFHPKINDKSALLTLKNRSKNSKLRDASYDSSKENHSDQSNSFSRASKGRSRNNSMNNIKNPSYSGGLSNVGEPFRPQLYRSKSTELIQKQRGIEKSFQIHEHLYNNRHAKELRIQELLQKKEEEQRRVGTPSLSINDNRKSELLLQGRKLRKFEEIFRILDEDGDGYITGEVVSMNKLNHDVLTFIKPFLNELEKNGKCMDLRRFCIVMDNICNSMNFLERDKFFLQEAGRKSVKEKGIYNNCTFKPQLNERSLIMAKKKESFRGNTCSYAGGKYSTTNTSKLESVGALKDDSFGLKNFPQTGKYFFGRNPKLNNTSLLKDDSFTQCQKDFQSFIEKYSSCF